jgi:hypothetical protein
LVTVFGRLYTGLSAGLLVLRVLVCPEASGRVATTVFPFVTVFALGVTVLDFTEEVPATVAAWPLKPARPFPELLLWELELLV